MSVEWKINLINEDKRENSSQGSFIVSTILRGRGKNKCEGKAPATKNHNPKVAGRLASLAERKLV